jgi:hypothetical protein
MTPPDPKSAEVSVPPVDTSKRFDVYCREVGERTIVYRNARFKGVQRLLSTQKFDVMSDFYDLELAGGQSIFISRMSVFKFCEHGVEPVAEVVAQK